MFSPNWAGALVIVTGELETKGLVVDGKAINSLV
jgi:hypothetical protein